MKCVLLSKEAVLPILACVCLGAHPAWAAVTAPYVSDANTLALYHFDEAAGAANPGNPVVNYGTGGNGLNLTNTGGPNGRDNTGAGGYGAAGYAGYGSSFNILATGNGSYSGTTSSQGGGVLTSSVAQSALQGANGAFTYEALIRFNPGTLDISGEQTILSHDGSTDSTRGFLFRVVGGSLSFYPGQIQGSLSAAAITATIPTTGIHAAATDTWYHVAVTYSGAEGVANNTSLYWTALDSGATQANRIGDGTLAGDLTSSGAVNPFGVGTTTRNPYRFQFKGLIDEVRISDVARGANEFIFSAVPEPHVSLLFGVGVATLIFRRRRS